MTTHIMQSDHMALRALIDEKLNDPSQTVRELGELARMEFENMLEEQKEEWILIDGLLPFPYVTMTGRTVLTLPSEETIRRACEWLTSHPEAKP